MKRSGLADSPFFSESPTREVFRSQPAPPTAIGSSPDHQSPLNEIPSEPLHVRSDERLNTRTNEQMNERTPERLNTRTDEQMNERTPERLNKKAARPIHRQSYDVYDDQAEAIEALCLKWRKQRGRHITKGEAMRELLDAILPSKV